MPTHFHIHWESGALDWEPFATRWEAESSAGQLARVNESFSIQEFGENCPRCLGLMSPERAAKPEKNKRIA